MRRRRSPAMEPLNVNAWRDSLLLARPHWRESVEWVEKKLCRCESELERVFVMLLGVLTAGVDNISFAGEFPPQSEGVGRRFVLDITQQVPVAGYRCDFMLTIRSVTSQRFMRLAIECDGHSFHDRTPEQASSDRQRDRKLLAIAVPTLRYTFSDLTKRPDEFMQDFHLTIRMIANNFCDQDAMRDG
jgi:very-short-patch-repair endonuclease